MTINTQTPRVVITGNGTRGPYNFTDSSSQAIRAISTSHIRLTRYAASTDDNNDGSLLVENTDYTVGGSQDARTFTLTSAQAVLTSSQRIVAERVQGYNQDLDLTTGGAFNATSIESRFDKVAEFQQELKARLDRVPALQFADATANVAFPSPPTSATQFLARNTTGEIVYATAADLSADVALGTGWETILGLPAAGTIDNLSGVRYVATRADLKALTTSSGLANGALYDVYDRDTTDDNAGGRFKRVDSDQSSILVVSTKTVTAVDTTRDLLYSASHGMLTNDVVIASAADAGLSLETLYYLRCAEETAALAQGSTPANVYSGAFLYSIGGTIYSKSAVAAGTAPGNDVIPADLWGCVAFEIGADGTIDAIEAPANSTGYAEKYMARNALPTVQANHIRIGDVCVKRAGSTFTFGITSLSASNVLAIYTQATPRTFMPGWFSLHTSYADATSGSSKVNITALSSLSLKKLRDPQQGVYVISNGDALDGSDGCFKRQFTGPVFARWFGGEGGGGDALQAAAGFALCSTFAHVHFPVNGQVNIDRSVKIWLPEVATAPLNTSAICCLKISGMGKSVTRMHRESGDLIHIVGGGQGNSVDFTGFSPITGSAGGGTAIKLENQDPYGFFGEFTGASRIDLNFSGDDGLSLTNYWDLGVDCIDWSNIDFTGSRFWGASTPSGKGIRTRALYGNFACVFDMVAVGFRFLALGYEYGTGSQTANLTSCFFAQCINDVVATADGTDHQGLSITNCEMYKGGDGDGVVINCRVPTFNYTNNRTAVHAGRSALVMTVTDQSNITDNKLFPDETVNSATSGFSIAGSVSGTICNIDNNNFASVNVAISLASTSSGVTVGSGNIYTGNITNVSNSAGSANLVNSPAQYVVPASQLIGANTTAITATQIIHSATDKNLYATGGSSGMLLASVNDANNSYQPLALDASVVNIGGGGIINPSTEIQLNGTAVVDANRLVQFRGYTVATLPAGAVGKQAFATDGRKNGEGGGSGTGVPVFHDGTAWRAYDTGATVAA